MFLPTICMCFYRHLLEIYQQLLLITVFYLFIIIARHENTVFSRDKFCILCTALMTRMCNLQSMTHEVQLTANDAKRKLTREAQLSVN